MKTVADRVERVVEALVGERTPLALKFWDGSTLGPSDSTARVVVLSPRALRRLLYSPNELGLGRAYVAGELDIEGDVFSVLRARDLVSAEPAQASLVLGPAKWLLLLRTAFAIGALGPPLRRPREEARLRGRKHSKARDAAAISHHYDVSNDFYRLVLGDSMTYSCAYFPREGATLEEAQSHKYEVVCRKLVLRPGIRLLDVGCGWGGMIIHAAKHHGVNAVGVTISRNQADYAAKAIAEAGVASQCEVRYQDYRDITDGPFEAISSIGMFEHVGLEKLGQYFGALNGLLAMGGRLLNHGISRLSRSSGIDPKSFVGRYVFPDGELVEVGTVVSIMQERGFEVRDVESLREHYALTLRKWVANLEANWDLAVSNASVAKARIWRLYMAGSVVSFEAGRIGVNQVLAVKPNPDGRSEMPLRRPI